MVWALVATMISFFTLGSIGCGDGKKGSGGGGAGSKK
jgi:hypothetical protein